VDRAPLPPHERPWRHPSELGPPEHEPTSTRGRVLIVTTATLSLLLVGALALSMTPGQGPGPIAVGSTTAEASTRPAALEQPGLPMVTPLGDEGYGVTTAGAAGGSRARMAARLPSGAVVDVYIVRRDEASGVTLVSLPTRTSGYELAASRPAPSDTVVVQAREPIVVAMVDIAGLDVAEGTPVLDDQGDLVGLCTWDADTITVMTVSTMPGAEPASTTSAPRTTVVTTTVLVTVPPTTPSTTALPAATTTAPATTTATTSVTSTTVPGTTAGPGVNGGVASTTAPG
jgi:hypothetical protein